jgi:hypothetical protein
MKMREEGKQEEECEKQSIRWRRIRKILNSRTGEWDEE